jgi:UDP-N-acetylglucosamine--N-acetylmuramyl-(pentapeptide) pyrophosphoryl-undecaprenol N-acetylglucosamine transferase
MKLERVIISGGGTGGHIFPAIAIADALKKLSPQIEILFVGAIGKMEMEKVPQAGYRIEGINISGLQRNFSIDNLYFPFKLIDSICQSKKIIERFKPQVVVGTGGFASGPLIYSATRKKIPALIQEQNAQPGLTNKILSKWASKICVAYPGLEQFFNPSKIVLTGNPVRDDIENNTYSREAGIKEFGLDPHKKTVLIYGGSLGALAINEGTQNALESLQLQNIQVIWQTGRFYFERAKKFVEEKGFTNVWVNEFIGKMDAAYAAADLVVCRAGAIAISELCLNGKAVILVPLPTAAADHQTKNAMQLVERNAALLLTNAEAKEQLVHKVLEVIRDEHKLESLSNNIAKMAMRKSGEAIANEVLKLI